MSRNSAGSSRNGNDGVLCMVGGSMKCEVIHSKSDDQGQIFAMDLRDMMKDALRLQIVCQA